MTNSDAPALPPTVRAALDAPTLEKRDWPTSLAPQLIGLFLWIAFFDQIPAETLGHSGLLWPVGGAAVGGILGYLLLFRCPALWCWRSRLPAAVVWTRTFGIEGSAWVPGLLLTLVQVVWLAVATRYATSLSLTGLELIGLLDPGFQRPLRFGAIELPGALFLFTSLAWAFAAAFTGRYLVRVIAALMNVYPILPAFLLGMTAAVALRTVPDYQGRFARVAVGRFGTAEGWTAAATTAQMVFGFFSAAALLLAHWGIVARQKRDVTRGGWTGAAFAPWIVVTLALLCVAGAVPRWGMDVTFGPLAYQRFSFAQALRTLIGGKTAGGFLLCFGLVALAPACYAGYLIGDGLNQRVPRLSRSAWTAVGTFVAWLLVAMGLGGHLRPLFDVMGALFAPACGAIAADYLRSRGAWPGARRGWNGPGVLAWGVGAALAATPLVAASLGSKALASAQPAAVFGFLAAFMTYLVLAALGSESPLEPTIGPRAEEVRAGVN